MATCKECIHEKLCVIKAFPDAFENTEWSKKPCDHFKPIATLGGYNSEGEWIRSGQDSSECSLCGKENNNSRCWNRYCPNCGAHMTYNFGRVKK